MFLFFRCKYENKNEVDDGDENFSPDDYNFSHLYNEDRLLPLEQTSIGVGCEDVVFSHPTLSVGSFCPASSRYSQGCG